MKEGNKKKRKEEDNIFFSLSENNFARAKIHLARARNLSVE